MTGATIIPFPSPQPDETEGERLWREALAESHRKCDEREE